MGRGGVVMRWLVLCSLAAWSVVSLGRYETAGMMFRLAERVLAARQTQRGMEMTRLAYVLSHDLVIAEERSRMLTALIKVAPPKFRWKMMRSILQIAAQQVKLHPHRSEAWAMLANAQMLSGQVLMSRHSQQRCMGLDPYGTTLSK